MHDDVQTLKPLFEGKRPTAVAKQGKCGPPPAPGVTRAPQCGRQTRLWLTKPYRGPMAPRQISSLLWVG